MPYPKYKLLKKSNKIGKSLKATESNLNLKDDLFSPFSNEMGFKSFLGTFPNDIKDSTSIKGLVEKIRFSRKIGKPFIINLNKNIITGKMVPIIIDLMERGWISALSADLFFAISDFEISLSDRFVDYENLIVNNKEADGISEETGLFFNIALREAAEKSMGLGEALGSYIEHSRFDYSMNSISYNAYKLNIPITIYSTFGSHPIYFHSSLKNQEIGNFLEKDFILFSSIISKMDGGGVLLLLDPDISSLNVMLNSILFNRITNNLLKGYYFSIIKSFFSERISVTIDMLSKREDLTLFDLKGEIDIIFPLLSALIKQ